MQIPSEQSADAGTAVRNAASCSVYPNYQDAKDADGVGSEQDRPAVSLSAAASQGDAEISLQQQIDRAVARSFLHRLIAKAFEYPTEESWAWLSDATNHAVVRSAMAGLNASPAFQLLGDAFLQEMAATDYEAFLASHLVSFGHAARGPNPMNEIEYGDLKADPLFQPHRLADLAAFYRAFGLEVCDDASERHDHICMELEFMSVLAAKEAYVLEHQFDAEAVWLVRSAQKQFLREHLGRWVPAAARRLARSAGTGAIAALADFTRTFVVWECDRFGVTAGHDEVVLRPVDESAESLCGSCGLNQLPPGALTAT